MLRFYVPVEATVVKTTEPGPTCRIKGRTKARPGPLDATPLAYLSA